MKFYIITLFLALFFISCQTKNFELKKNQLIGIDFSNDLTFTDDFNVYKYRNFYNGGGVALGDINNDGLLDIYLTSNQGKNKLYLNLGDFKFKDITDQAGVGGSKAWSTGVTMVDINADGFIDIYVCNSGDIDGDNKENELFINEGDLTFSDQAKKFNLDDGGFSTHANFFDYDKDGDLDVYLLNNSYQAIGSFDLRRNERPKRDLLGGDKLMQNQNGYFVDVSEEAGIYGSVIGFGLGVTVGDVNGDNWDDIFVSNDFFERDYLYINQKDGTFNEQLTDQMNSISGASMGADIADIDNNGTNDIFVTEMLPSSYQRLKSVTTFEGWDKFQYNVKNGYHNQFTRNVLHLNTHNNKFTEIGRMAGVDATDWSWGALFFDYDNDGFKDLFVANGIYKDLTNQDYLQYISNSEVVKSIVSNNKVNYKKLVEIIPSNPIPNHLFKNIDGINFIDIKNSGLETPSFSNGSAYGDLDNDGDLDLIVNNVNMPVFVYENKTDDSSNFIKVELVGEDQNLNSLGAKVYISIDSETQMQQVQAVRGFQSSVDIRPNFGIGQNKKLDILVHWPSGKVTSIKDIDANQCLKLFERDAQFETNDSEINSNVIFKKIKLSEEIIHKENKYVDFNRDRLLYHMCSTEGPKMEIGDVDNDGNIDFLISASLGQNLELYQVNSKENGNLNYKNTFLENLGFENSELLFFDADGDLDLDLYIGSGSVELSMYSQLLHDRLFINDGKGNFKDSNQNLPDDNSNISTGAVSYADIDQDGDLDLFVGERLKINNYGYPASGFILKNDGKGNFTNETLTIAPELFEIGMITDAKFYDIDNDADQDLIIVGEYMGVEIFENTKGVFSKINSTLHSKKGWWNSLKIEDLNNDGYPDLIIGNHGLNSKFKASDEFPIQLFTNDFDDNGFSESIICFKEDNGKMYPFALRHDLIEQIKSLKKKFPDYESFKNADLEKIIDEKKLKESHISEVNYLETSIFLNKGNFKFEKVNIPKEVQFSPVYAIETHDFDNDGDIDIIMGGNLYGVKPEFGIYDASFGIYLENLGGNKFKYVQDGKGFFVEGQIRDIKIFKDHVYVAKNNSETEVFQIQLNDK